MKDVDFTPPTDSLLRKPRLDHVFQAPLLGIALRFETNSAYVRDRLEETFGPWCSLPPESVERLGNPLRITLQIIDGDERAANGDQPQLRYICYDDARYLVHTPASVAMVDPDRGEASAYLTAQLVSHETLFRHSVIEAIGLSLVAHHDRHPVHASAIGTGDRVILLAGASGVGKSTLAYMAHAAGLDVLTEDAVWVQLHPELRFWGWARHIHLTREAIRFFPELAAHAEGHTDALGKIVVPVETAHEASSFVKTNGTVCIIERGENAPKLEKLSRDDLTRILTTQLTQGYDRYPERVDSTIAALVRGGGWRLTLTDDPRDAFPFLLQLMEQSA